MAVAASAVDARSPAGGVEPGEVRTWAMGLAFAHENAIAHDRGSSSGPVRELVRVRVIAGG